MFKLVVCFLLVAIAAVSAGYIAYGPAHVGLGAYGAHGPFAISYSARVDTPRRVVAFAPASYGHYYHY